MREWRFGPAVSPGGATFRVWAPAQPTIAVAIEGEPERTLVRDDQGFHQLHVPAARAGQR